MLRSDASSETRNRTRKPFFRRPWEYKKKRHPDSRSGDFAANHRNGRWAQLPFECRRVVSWLPQLSCSEGGTLQRAWAATQNQIISKILDPHLPAGHALVLAIVWPFFVVGGRPRANGRFCSVFRALPSVLAVFEEQNG